MAFTSLSLRLPTLPLVLAGPILRRLEKDKVSVWVALKEERTLHLVIYDDSTTTPTVVITGEAHTTVKLGINLHVAVLTVRFQSGATGFEIGKTYGYSVMTQNNDDLTPCDDVTYYPQRFSRPTFTLPPASLNDLRIIHGSCRKMHAQGEDAFVVVDQMLEDESSQPLTYAKARPHQLFLTGDQIYADDVDATLLYLIKDASQALLGWTEEIKDVGGSLLTNPSHENAAPGMRGYLIDDWSGFKFPFDDGQYITSLPSNIAERKPSTAASHLMFLGEYYCMYLLMWSPVLWPAEAKESYYPTYRQVYATRVTGIVVPGEEEFKDLRWSGNSGQNRVSSFLRHERQPSTYKTPAL